MDDSVYEKYKLAGEVAADARNYGVGLIKPGVSLLEVAESVESRILDHGAGLAFPVNISINEVAAHYTPKYNDVRVFKKGDVVKLDVGAHVDGYIADTAVTVEVETHVYTDMIKAAGDALDTAIGLMKPGVDLSMVGKAVEETIAGYGYKPVDNLTGHSLKQYILHAGISVPSVYEISSRVKPKADDVLAVEPFVSNGAGHVVSGGGSNIYRCNPGIRLKLVRDQRSRKLFNDLVREFKTLPFAQRWFEKLFKNSNDIVLRRLSFHGFIKHYPQLVDAKKGIVTQKEHTVIITQDGCEVTTL